MSKFYTEFHIPNQQQVSTELHTATCSAGISLTKVTYSVITVT